MLLGTMLFMYLGGAKAQTVSNQVYAKDWTAATEIPAWYHKEGCATDFPNLDGKTLNIKKDGEVTVNYGTQVQIANGIPTIEGNDYTVRLRIKGTGTGTIACKLGDWSNSDPYYGINIPSEVQTIEFKYINISAQQGDSWIIIWAGSYDGTLSIESVEVYCNTPRFYVYDYAGKTSFPWYHDAGWGTTPTVGSDILTATNESELGDPSNYMFFVADNIYTETGKDYIVRATVKGSVAGTIKCNFGTWGQSVTSDLALSTEYQAVDVKFSGLSTAGANHVVFHIGKYVGTVSLKKIEVLEGIRSVKVGAAGWATLYSDKALDFSGTGLTAYTASVAGSTVTLTAVDDVPANTGVVLKGDENTYDIPVIASSSTAKGNLTGSTTDALVYDEGAANDYFFLALKDGKAQFTKLTSGTIAAGKAYLSLTKASYARELNIVFDDDEMTTGISVAPMNNERMNNEYFDLQGRRIAQPTKGLYIVNGKKVIIK